MLGRLLNLRLDERLDKLPVLLLSMLVLHLPVRLKKVGLANTHRIPPDTGNGPPTPDRHTAMLLEQRAVL